MAIEDIRRQMAEKMRQSCPGLGALAVSDNDGVVLLKVVLDEASQLDPATR